MLTSPAHFYFIHLPDNFKNIAIQFEGSYVESNYEQGKKINTWNPRHESKELGLNTNSRNVVIENKNEKTNI